MAIKKGVRPLRMLLMLYYLGRGRRGFVLFSLFLTNNSSRHNHLALPGKLFYILVTSNTLDYTTNFALTLIVIIQTTLRITPTTDQNGKKTKLKHNRDFDSWKLSHNLT